MNSVNAPSWLDGWRYKSGVTEPCIDLSIGVLLGPERRPQNFEQDALECRPMAKTLIVKKTRYFSVTFNRDRSDVTSQAIRKLIRNQCAQRQMMIFQITFQKRAPRRSWRHLPAASSTASPPEGLQRRYKTLNHAV